MGETAKRKSMLSLSKLLHPDKDFGCFSLRNSMSIANSHLFLYDDFRPQIRELMDAIHRANMIQVAVNTLLLEEDDV